MTKVKIICSKHDIFEQTPNCHLDNKGCAKCSGNVSLTNTEFIEKANLKHNNKYDYSLVDYTRGKNKIKILCPKHGEFIQSGEGHLFGAGCPTCSESRGEREVRNYLESIGINYITQYRFLNCKSKKPLPFDFYLPDLNICIEYHGTQHYISFEHFGGDDKLERTQKHDKIKSDYCKNNNIKLIVIKYNESIIDGLVYSLSLSGN